jgi:dienelactone hydrolase
MTGIMRIITTSGKCHQWDAKFRKSGILATSLVIGVLGTWVLGAEPTVIQGRGTFAVSEAESRIETRFQLQAHEFDFEQKPIGAATDQLSLWNVTFPSPVVTPHESNNTVHCEYFLPKRKEKVPAVVVLHILGGDFALSRLFCTGLADHGVAALFLKMPYYGPRRQPGVDRRMISQDPHETVEGFTQAVLDIRRATAFLASQKEIDSDRLGIFGISLGGITGSLAMTAEPRLKNGCFLLAGGDLAKVAWESKELEKVRRRWIEKGGDEQGFRDILEVVDPARYGEHVRGRRILMLNAKEDEVIPKACTESLWESFGKPEIVWYDGGHYSVARHLLDAIRRSGKFFAAAEQGGSRP